MTVFHCLHGECPPIPDNLTVAQFMLDAHDPLRPYRTDKVPWLIEDATGRTVGYEELRARTYGLANALHTSAGINENDVVCIFSPNHIDYPVAIWAVHRLGAVVSTANPVYTVDELTHQLLLTKSKAVICHPDAIETTAAAARKCGIPKERIILMHKPQTASFEQHLTLDELVHAGSLKPCSFIEPKLKPGEAKTKLAFLSFSSGTTGKPKAVEIPHYSLIANTLQMAAFYKINEEYAAWDEKWFRVGDKATAVLPFFHIYGLAMNLHFLMFAGVSIVVIPKFNFIDYLKSIDKYKITHLLIVPPQAVLLCKHPEVKKYNLSHVRYTCSGAAPLAAEIVQQLIEVLPSSCIGQGFGMTEAAACVSLFPLSQKIGTSGSAGQLIPGVSARVVKHDGTLAACNEEGELVVTGPQMGLRYRENEQASKETFQDLDGHRWVHTGDIVKIDEAGEIYIVDRLKEIMKVRGFQVAPAELEGHLLDHHDVADVCVVGVPDEYSGELPLAFVVLNNAASERMKSDPKEEDKIKKSIYEHVAGSKAQYKWLAGGVEIVDAIPKTASGKLLRRVMRDKVKDIKGRVPIKSKGKL